MRLFIDTGLDSLPESSEEQEEEGEGGIGLQEELYH